MTAICSPYPSATWRSRALYVMFNWPPSNLKSEVGVRKRDLLKTRLLRIQFYSSRKMLWFDPLYTKLKKQQKKTRKNRFGTKSLRNPITNKQSCRNERDDCFQRLWVTEFCIQSFIFLINPNIRILLSLSKTINSSQLQSLFKNTRISPEHRYQIWWSELK